jgi:hypothetical protein
MRNRPFLQSRPPQSSSLCRICIGKYRRSIQRASSFRSRLASNAPATEATAVDPKYKFEGLSIEKRESRSPRGKPERQFYRNHARCSETPADRQPGREMINTPCGGQRPLVVRRQQDVRRPQRRRARRSQPCTRRERRRPRLPPRCSTR